MTILELWDVYDKNRNFTGKTIERGGVFGKDEYHLVTHVCIFNGNNELLIQQRQPWKMGWSNMWDLTVGGSALAGETSHEAAERETAEEIGYTIDLSDERPYFTINSEAGFDDYYLIEQEIDITQLKLQYEEVQNVKWASKSQIMELVREGIFIDYWFIELLFDMRERRGALRFSSTE